MGEGVKEGGLSFLNKFNLKKQCEIVIRSFISLLQEPVGVMDFGKNLVNNVVMKKGSCRKGSKDQLESPIN